MSQFELEKVNFCGQTFAFWLRLEIFPEKSECNQLRAIWQSGIICMARQSITAALTHLH